MDIREFNKYTIKLLFFSGVMGILVLTAYFLLPTEKFSPAIPFLILLFFSVSLIVHYILLKAKAKRFSKFSAAFMLSTFARLFFYLIIIVLYMINFKSDAINFTVAFLILYVFYTFFEVRELLLSSTNSK